MAWHDPDWTWLKAQGIAESNLNPLAVSPVGAAGLMQFMPVTWTECQKALNIHASPLDARASILCSGWYMNIMLKIWKDPRTTLDRWRWAWASYNWGVGNVLRAQKKIYGRAEYRFLHHYLPKETQGYTTRIERLHETIQCKPR